MRIALLRGLLPVGATGDTPDDRRSRCWMIWHTTLSTSIPTWVNRVGAWRLARRTRVALGSQTS